MLTANCKCRQTCMKYLIIREEFRDKRSRMLLTWSIVTGAWCSWCREYLLCEKTPWWVQTQLSVCVDTEIDSLASDRSLLHRILQEKPSSYSRSRSQCITFSVAPLDGKCMFSYLMAIMFALSLTIYKIFANQINCQKFDLKMKVKVKNWTCTIWLEMFVTI